MDEIDTLLRFLYEHGGGPLDRAVTEEGTGIDEADAHLALKHCMSQGLVRQDGRRWALTADREALRDVYESNDALDRFHELYGEDDREQGDGTADER